MSSILQRVAPIGEARDREIERALLLRHARVENDLQQQVSSLKKRIN